MRTIKGSERNQPCPRCGKKMKECLGHSRKSPWTLSNIVVGVMCVFALVAGVKLRQREDFDSSIRKTIAAHIANRPITPWLIAGDLEPEHAIDFIHQWSPTISSIPEKYRNIDETARKIADLGPYSVGIMDSSGHFMSEYPEARRSQMIFFPETLFHVMPSVCWYKPELHGILVAAIPWPPIVLDGMMMHEALHYEYHVAGRPSATAPERSREWIAEEVDAHRLEMIVFDRGSGGKYSQTLDAIVNRWKPKADYKDVVGFTKPEDLESLNRAVGCDPCTRRLTNVLIKQHFLSIGFRQIDRKGLSEDARRQADAELYDWLWDY